MAEMFKNLGYSTAHFGKWHLGSFGESIPTKQGFDEFYGILNTTDETLYAKSIKESHLDHKYRFEQPMIHEGLGGQDLTAVKPFNEETRRTIDVEIATKSTDFIKRQAGKDKPFFLYIPWTRPHYPNLPSEEFAGKSRIGDYGDSVMELDHNTGKVLDALKEAGIEDDTIVIWLSDNGPMETTTWPDSGNAGRYRGELGDAYEGSIRTAGMMRWPGKIQSGKTNEMIAMLDLLPTLAEIVGGEMPTDRPIDGIDQSDFLLGKQGASNREHLLSFIGDQLVALRWNQYRLYFVDYEPSGEWFKQAGAGANALPRGWAPKVYNIERDPGEKQDISQYSGWMVPHMMRHIMKYQASVRKFPNLPAPNFTRW
jgi:arylsulfatase